MSELTEKERIRAAADKIEDGVYFDLPDEIYHAVERLNTSGIQKLDISPADFWCGSYLDPDAPELDEEQTKAQILGKAYHCARLEPLRFTNSYCRAPSKDDYPEAELLTSDAAIKAELKARGETQSIGDETSEERAQRLVDAGYKGWIWTLVLRDWEAGRNDCIGIPAKLWDDLQRDMIRIHENAEISALLSDGYPEVSIFWTDRNGIRMKTRIDYLRLDGWVDFKTFETKGAQLDRSLINAVQYNRYHIQAAVQFDAMRAIATGELPVFGDAEQDQFIGALIDADDNAGWPVCTFIFQQKGGVPNLVARDFQFFSVPLFVRAQHAGASTEAIALVDAATRTETALYRKALTDIIRAKKAFMLYSEVYQRGTPWAPLNARANFEDVDFPPWFLEQQ